MFDFPNAPSTGSQTTAPNGVVYTWDGTAWRPVGVPLPPIGAVVAATPPSGVAPGTLWYDSTGGQEYVLFNDGNSTQWVPTTNIGLANAATQADVAKNAGRNYVQNPTFTVQQRSAGPFTASGYNIDRWKSYAVNDTMSFSAVALADADRAAIGDEAARFALQNVFAGSATVGSLNVETQSIESVRRLGGKSITVSFWAVATAAGRRLGVGLSQIFGTGGSPSATTNVNGQSVALSTTWARYSLTFAIPSTAGKTLGSNGDDHTDLNIWYSCEASNNALSGSVGVQSGTISLWGVQLEVGTQATPLDYGGSQQQQLAQCQRFYHTGAFAIAGGGTTSVGVQAYQTYPVRMRAVPTIVGTTGQYNGLTGGGVRASTIDGAGYLDLNAGVTTANAYSYNGTYTASADL